MEVNEKDKGEVRNERGGTLLQYGAYGTIYAGYKWLDHCLNLLVIKIPVIKDGPML
jgi:hypothetical protein